MIGNYHFPGDYGCPAPGMPLCRKQSRRNRDAPMWSSFVEFEACERSDSILLLFSRLPPPPIFFVNSSFLWELRVFHFPDFSGKAKRPWDTGVSSRKSLARFHSSRRVKWWGKPRAKALVGQAWFTGLKAGASTSKHICAPLRSAQGRLFRRPIDSAHVSFANPSATLRASYGAPGLRGGFNGLV